MLIREHDAGIVVEFNISFIDTTSTNLPGLMEVFFCLKISQTEQ